MWGLGGGGKHSKTISELFMQKDAYHMLMPNHKPNSLINELEETTITHQKQFEQQFRIGVVTTVLIELLSSKEMFAFGIKT